MFANTGYQCVQLKLDDKTQHAGTDIMSFKFERKTDIDSASKPSATATELLS